MCRLSRLHAGTHTGAELYTIGQSARISGATARWIVVSKPKHSSDVMVAQGPSSDALMATSLRMSAADFNWLSPSVAAAQSMQCRFKLRHGQGEVGQP
jgi:tRNA U34 2-thiouridine synthase MnmA/TrmU